MAYLKSQHREFEKNRSDSSQILVAEQALMPLEKKLLKDKKASCSLP